MLKKQNIPVALTIAGSDSGGGAGIQADLKTFAAIGVHGTSAITCLTAQNPKCVSAVQPAAPVFVSQQIEAVFAELPPQAVKTGMLYSEEIILVVADALSAHNKVPLVIDPVMVSTSGTRLLQESAVNTLKQKLLPRAILVTPNLSEAEILANMPITSIEEMRLAAKKIYAEFGCAALVKGGHLRGATEAADIFYDGHEELLLTTPFVKNVKTHGTGCVYSAAVTAHLALGREVSDTIWRAKEFITQAIAQSYPVRGYSVLNSFWRTR